METYEKVTDEILKVIRNDTSSQTFEISRAEIQTQLDHLKHAKVEAEADFNNKIKVLEAKIAVLDK